MVQCKYCYNELRPVLGNCVVERLLSVISHYRKYEVIYTSIRDHQTLTHEPTDTNIALCDTGIEIWGLRDQDTCISNYVVQM